MITFKEFLLENDQTLQEYAEMHCGPFLKEFGGLENYLKSPIYRGSNSLNEKESIVLDWQNKKIKCYFGTVRENRETKDTHNFISNHLDRRMKAQFGWSGRSNAVFGSSDKAVAIQYGTVYAILPIGDFRYIFSPSISDFTVSLTNKMENVNPKWPPFKYLGDENTISAEDKKTIIDIADDITADYQNTNLKLAIKNEVEISINCKKYLAISGYN